MPYPTISVIIPTLNEGGTLASTLDRLLQEPNLEVIVADGGSTDDTCAQAQAKGVQVVQATGGRGAQLNQGAAVATGEILIFLHADTQLPANVEILVQQALAEPDTVAGAFDLAIDGPGWRLRWIEQGVKWRSRWLRLPYGDQALFLTAEHFHRMGGFANLPIMEDFDLVQRLNRQGRIAMVSTPVTTSNRRWQRLGVWRTTVANQAMVIGYLLGLDIHSLAHWYRSLGKSRTPSS
ncbi:MAG: TIGR04283 family arsenosugar biosynthesis glycosyltransferase [Spirulina sp.]